jgi:hypothetical protein
VCLQWLAAFRGGRAQPAAGLPTATLMHWPYGGLLGTGRQVVCACSGWRLGTSRDVVAPACSGWRRSGAGRGSRVCWASSRRHKGWRLGSSATAGFPHLHRAAARQRWPVVSVSWQERRAFGSALVFVFYNHNIWLPAGHLCQRAASAARAGRQGLLAHTCRRRAPLIGLVWDVHVAWHAC